VLTKVHRFCDVELCVCDFRLAVLGVWGKVVDWLCWKLKKILVFGLINIFLIPPIIPKRGPHGGHGQKRRKNKKRGGASGKYCWQRRG